ncbi:MAG: TRAP transporter substrate-binding protein [Gammaproteobacteria bacterium]|uniref:TRAP transporter substrate-binding protein n=1 Tax=Rhodoferax sp. TaxID=50421 RepID=UPI0017B06286|nr:TRAP transporter substrate-binding protein [Rhodoferax sp.]MBU3900138.1 TRAP transporter substrate-binding protein [Gammaproteobacteria bacterium]MBA3058728.1 TRAP transporter substrate-binding protein [Rhodoferax sp.]MBU4018322.1 TRAP transporter substrate-binding protein [Gammaproteobacteria bacterium]MBU4082176.1 TRAP transporter substrate-binding protein [Gammaproteobacteria bacterium]MBU4112435.1 TRAP transporter substrate-binding protein [Gammaproteobacteria bacterium]
MKKLALSLMLGVAVACTAFAADPAKKPIVMKLGHIQNESDLWHLGALKFAELVDAKTKGEVQVKVFPNSTIGNDRDMAEGLQIGSVDFALIAGVLGNFEPSIQIMELPYLFKDETHLRKVMYGPIGDQILDNLLKSSDIRGLTFWERGPRQLTTNKPVNSLSDIKGLKIRVPEIPPIIAAWKAMGTNPTPMAWGEVYTGLQQNVIEAQENPIPFIHAGKIYEVQKYIAMTNHKYEYVLIAMSNKAWLKLNPQQQKAVKEAAAESTQYENKLVFEKSDNLLKDLQAKGMKVTKPDTTEWAKLARTVHQQFAEKYGIDLYNKIIEAGK